MEYRESLNIGSKAEGVIKCTYATIHDAQGNRLFSLQNVNAQYGVTYEGGYKEGESTKQDMIITQLTPDIYFADSGFGGVTSGDADIRGGITMKVPLVEITTISNARLVPAKLTKEGAKLIINACKNVRVVNAKYKKLIEVLDSNQTIYIKPAAFDWHPVDITNATITDKDGKEISLDIALDAAKKKMDTAKALLAGAAITNIF